MKKVIKKINNGFDECYYLDSEGRVYNASTDKYIKQRAKHQYNLKTIDKGYKLISLKRLYKLVYDANYCLDAIEDLPGEEWKPIDKNKEYFISSCGRVKSLKGYEAVLLKPSITNGGYERVELSINGHRCCKLIHRLVASAFLPQPTSIDQHIHHLSGQPNENNKNNLLWVEPEEHRTLHRVMNEIKVDKMVRKKDADE